jgi:hypothetical protein
MVNHDVSVMPVVSLNFHNTFVSCTNSLTSYSLGFRYTKLNISTRNRLVMSYLTDLSQVVAQCSQMTCACRNVGESRWPR